MYIAEFGGVSILITDSVVYITESTFTKLKEK